ncbi:MAG: hypothetical protein AAF539_02285 [Planctomycetota bacterium]
MQLSFLGQQTGAGSHPHAGATSQPPHAGAASQPPQADSPHPQPPMSLGELTAPPQHVGAGQHTSTGTCLQTTRGTHLVTV